jgi:hypothetical protein
LQLTAFGARDHWYFDSFRGAPRRQLKRRPFGRIHCHRSAQLVTIAGSNKRKSSPSEKPMWYEDPYFKLRPAPHPPPDELCQCPGPPPIKVMTALSNSPLHCIRCNLEIPPERLAFPGSLVEDIAEWRNVAGAFEHLWLDSREYEAWAKQELETITSAVNQRGLALCNNINAIHPCYYNYFQDQSVDDFLPITLCPNCGEKLEVYEGGIFRQQICQRCRIITVGE